mgnify:FL=1
MSIISVDELNFIEKVINNHRNDNIELEIRFGCYNKSGFKSSVSRRLFTKFKNELDSRVKSGKTTKAVNSNKFVGPTITESKDTFYDNNIRHTVETNTNIEYTIVKQIINKLDIVDYNLRLTVSTENRVNKPDTRPIFTRTKTRWSYILSFLRIDLTKVINNGEISYEVEFENLKPKNFNKKEFQALVEYCYKIYHETFNIYKEDERNNVLNNMAVLLPISPKDLQSASLGLPVAGEINKKIPQLKFRKNKIEFKSLAQGRSLKEQDLVSGGIVPLERKQLTTAIEQPKQGIVYTGTIKADGIRKLLYISDTGMYFVMAETDVNKITPGTVKTLINTIIEGEYIEKPKIATGIQFLMYDLLCLNGDYTVRDIRLEDRIKRLKDIESQLSNVNGLYAKTKDFFYINTVSDFFENNKIMLNTKPWFNTDGIIYTPTSKYNSELNIDRKFDRDLTKNPDLVKWKPLDLISIDFAISHQMVNGVQKVRLYTLDNRNLVLFTGSELYPFDNDTDIEQDDLINEQEGTIVEMQYINGKFRKMRVRDDKIYPNSSR